MVRDERIQRAFPALTSHASQSLAATTVLADEWRVRLQC
jgi:hypothetical protein